MADGDIWMGNSPGLCIMGARPLKAASAPVLVEIDTIKWSWNEGPPAAFLHNRGLSKDPERHLARREERP